MGATVMCVILDILVMFHAWCLQNIPNLFDKRQQQGEWNVYFRSAVDWVIYIESQLCVSWDIELLQENWQQGSEMMFFPLPVYWGIKMKASVRVLGT